MQPQSRITAQYNVAANTGGAGLACLKVDARLCQMIEYFQGSARGAQWLPIGHLCVWRFASLGAP